MLIELIPFIVFWYSNCMKNYVKPTSDLFIRYLLGSEENIDILLDFINTMLTDLEFAPAISLIIRNPFNLKELPDAKESSLDVKAREETGVTLPASEVDLLSTGGEIREGGRDENIVARRSDIREGPSGV